MILRGEHKPKTFENRVLRKISESRMDEMV
jgi:hypothetical protein